MVVNTNQRRPLPLYGTECYIYICYCQLKTLNQSQKKLYSKVYWIFSYWVLLDLGIPECKDTTVNPFAAVNLVEDGVAVVKRHFSVPRGSTKKSLKKLDKNLELDNLTEGPTTFLTAWSEKIFNCSKTSMCGGLKHQWIQFLF